MDSKIKYQFSAKLWKHNSEGAWYFVTVPTAYSKEIRENLQWQEEGWGRMKTIANVDNLTWKTSIWYDSKAQAYLLPIKAEVRKKLVLKEDDVISTSITI